MHFPHTALVLPLVNQQTDTALGGGASPNLTNENIPCQWSFGNVLLQYNFGYHYDHQNYESILKAFWILFFALDNQKQKAWNQSH